MKLLLVEDNKELNKALATILKRNSYLVDSAFDGEEALVYLNKFHYEVIILDVMIPKINGLEVLKKIREKNIESAVIMLTAKSTIEDKITGLDAGADDYLTKPFSISELLARIRALSRRHSTTVYTNENIITYGDISLNATSLSISKGDKSVSLMNKETQILKVLMERKGDVVSIDKINDVAWDITAYSTNENLWVFISYLRKKLESIGSSIKIKSKRNQGYYLEYKE